MVTNFFPIKFDFEEFQIQRLHYEQSTFENLKRTYNASHSVFRDSDFIYISPFSRADKPLGEIATLNIHKNPRVVGLLLRHILFRTFKESFPDIRPVSFSPLKFMSRNVKHDYVLDALPDHLKHKVSYKKQTDVQVRQALIAEKHTWGIIINTEFKWEFNITCADLVKEGFEPEGLEVVQLLPIAGLEDILAPTERHVGILGQVIGDLGYVSTNQGEKNFPLEQLSLRKTKSNIDKYLKFKIGEQKTQQVFQSITRRDAVRFNAKNLLDDISSVAKLLSKLVYQNLDGFTFSIIPNSNINLQVFKQENPTFLFSHDGYKRDIRADEGLKNFGPYDGIIFDTKKPKVLVVCHRYNRGSFSSFLAKLKSGIPDSQYFKSGMVGKYRLQDIEFVIEEISSYSIEEYIETLQRAFRLNSDVPFSLALIETKAEWKRFSPSNNPYYHVKSYLLSLGVPVQLLTNENTRKSDSYLGLLLNSIALQIYAKLGGTPWALPASTNIDRELIVGIGSATYRLNSFVNAPQSKIVGITTFFSSDGTYLFGNKCRDVSYDQYFSELLSNLDSSIKELSRRDGWVEGDTIRIVFHIFKPVKNIEADVIAKLIETYQQYNIKYAFVTISDDHPFMLFDPAQPGISSPGGTKGQFTVSRGESVVLSDNACLMQMKGPKQVKTVRQGTSRPLLIKIHDKSTFKDLYYITQQIYNFSTLSWRSFFPAQMPVTLYYSDLIVDVLSNLRSINGWKSEVINGPLKFKKWFL
jgi:Piwi domain.